MAGGGGGRDNLLVLGLIERTVFLEMDEEGGLEAVERVGGLIDSEETIALKQVGAVIVQVTTNQILITENGSRKAGRKGKISTAQITDNRILLSLGRELVLFNFQCDVIAQWTLQEEITCLDIFDRTIALGLWNSTVQLISLENGLITQLDWPLSAPARTIVLSDILPNQTTLQIGSRDGTLTTYTLPLQGPPVDRKSVSLGTQPLRLFPLKNLIFASSDRPTLIHLPLPSRPRNTPKKLILSALSIRDVLSLTPLTHPAYPDALVMATKEGFRIGKMDHMARLQVRSVGMPNGELPRRIARLEVARGGSAGETGVVGVISLRSGVDLDGSETAEGFFRVWDEDSWQCIYPPTLLLLVSKSFLVFLVSIWV